MLIFLIEFTSFSTTNHRDLAAAEGRGRRELHLRDQLHGDGHPHARGHLAPQLGTRPRQVPPGVQFNRHFWDIPKPLRLSSYYV